MFLYLIIYSMKRNQNEKNTSISKVKLEIIIGIETIYNMAAVDNWRTCLNDLKFFKQLRENNNTDSKQKKGTFSKSLLKILDTDLFVWDGYDDQLLNYNLKNFSTNSTEKKSRFQVKNKALNICICIRGI